MTLPKRGGPRGRKGQRNRLEVLAARAKLAEVVDAEAEAEVVAAVAPDPTDSEEYS